MHHSRNRNGLAKSVVVMVPFVAAFIALGCAARTESGKSAKDSLQAGDAAESASAGDTCVERASTLRTAPPDAPASIGLKRPEGATRTRPEACLRALEALEALEGGGEWQATLEAFSDSGVSTGGALGKVTPDDLEPAFAGAAFSLEQNQLSYVVETSRGFHVILRTE